MKKIIGFAIFILITVLACSKSGVREELPPREAYQRAMDLYEKGNYQKAQAALQRVIYSYPGLTFIDTAQYHLAMTYFNQKSYPEAAGEFRRMLQTYPGSAFADDAQFNLALAHYKQSPNYAKDQTETYAAIDEFGIFLYRYSSSPLVSDAEEKLSELSAKLAKKLYKSGELYLKLGNWEPALIYFEQVRDNYPNTEWAVLAFYHTGEAQEKLGRKSDALETYLNFVQAFPDHKLAPKAKKRVNELSPPAITGG